MRREANSPEVLLLTPEEIAELRRFWLQGRSSHIGIVGSQAHMPRAVLDGARVWVFGLERKP